VLGAELREPEVEHLHLLARRHEDVRRLDVAVDDAVCVGGVERLGDLNAERQDVGRRERPATDAIGGLPCKSSIAMNCFMLVDVVVVRCSGD
jgi:hypothetical protein